MEQLQLAMTVLEFAVREGRTAFVRVERGDLRIVLEGQTLPKRLHERKPAQERELAGSTTTLNRKGKSNGNNGL